MTTEDFMLELFLKIDAQIGAMPKHPQAGPQHTGLSVAQAIPGFLLYKTAKALSPNTLRCYQDQLKVWLKYTGDVAVDRITSTDLCNFLIWLRQTYQPHRVTGNTAPLSAKSLRNYWVSLSAFFTWATLEMDFPNPMKGCLCPSTRIHLWSHSRVRKLDSY